MPTEYEKIMATQKAARAAKASAGTQARADTLSNLRAASLADKKTTAQAAVADKKAAAADKKAAAQAAVAAAVAATRKAVKVAPTTLSRNTGITGGIKLAVMPTTMPSPMSGNTGIAGGLIKPSAPTTMPSPISGNTGITGGLIKPSIIAPTSTILPVAGGVPPVILSSIPTTLGPGIIPDENTRRLIASNILSAILGAKKSGNTGIAGGLIKPSTAPTVSGAPPEPVMDSAKPKAAAIPTPVIVALAGAALLLMLAM